MDKHVIEADVTGNDLIPVQNRTTILTPQAEAYVSRYRSFLKKTAEAVLGLAITLAEAKSKLNGVDFNMFCDEVGTPETSATFKKLIKIAENVGRFHPYVDRLPNTWTTIYKLAVLPSEKFERVSANLTPFITAREIDEIVGDEKTVRSLQQYEIKISLEDMLPEQKAKIYEEIDRLKSEYSFKVHEAMSLKEELKSFKTSNKV